MTGLVLLAALLCSIDIPVYGQQSDEETAIAHLRSIGVEFEIADERIVGVNFFRSKGTDSDARYLAAIPSLRDIDFGQRAFTDNAMTHISNLTNVRLINLSLCPVTNAGLAAICGNRDIESLDLTGTNITDLRPLTQLHKLQHLELQHCAIGDSQTTHLAKLRSLVKLNLASTEVTDVGVAALTKLPNLKALYLADARITDVGASALAECPSLERLQLAYSIGNGFEPARCNVSAAAIGELKKTLPALYVHGKPGRPTQVKLELVENNELVVKQMALVDLMGLNDKTVVMAIELSNTIVDDESLASLVQFTNLKSLKLARTWITDATLARIGALRHLETLDIRDTRVTDAGLVHLKTCTRLKTLNLHNTMITGSTFKELTGLENLSDVDISRNDGDTRWSGRLGLSPGISDEGLRAVSRLEWLNRLNLECFHFTPKVSGDGIRSLLKLTKLKELGIYGLPIDDDLTNELTRSLPETKLDYKTTYGFFD